MNTGEYIYKLRREKNITQEQLALELNVSRQSISRWENNETLPETAQLLQIAKLFDISIDALLAGVEKDRNKEMGKHELERINFKIFVFACFCFYQMVSAVFFTYYSKDLPKEDAIRLLNFSDYFASLFPLFCLFGILLISNDRRNKYLKVFGIFFFLKAILGVIVLNFINSMFAPYDNLSFYNSIKIIFNLFIIIIYVILIIIYIFDDRVEKNDEFSLVQREPLNCFLLMFFLSFMGFYFYVKINDELSSNTKFKQRDSFRCIILSLVTLGIYDFYWLVQQNKIIDEVAKEKGLSVNNNLFAQIITRIFFGRSISLALLQSRINNLLK